MIGVAIIGVGDIGRVYARAVANCSSARLVAVSDLDQSRLIWAAEEFGAASSTRPDDVVTRDDVDIVAICLPHHLHFPIGMAALAAGKHVLLEKPMATTVAECDALIDAARDGGLRLGVSHNRLLLPAIVRAREEIDAGLIGQPILLRQRLGIHEPYSGWRADPRKSGGGLLSDAGAHPFYIARELFGEIAKVRALLDVGPEQGESLALVWLEFRSGAHGLLEASYYGPSGMFDDSLEVVGSEAVLKLGGLEAASFGYRTEPVFERYNKRKWVTESVEFMDWEHSVMASVSAFLKAVETGGEALATGEDGRENVRLIHEAYSSAQLLGPFPGLFTGTVRLSGHSA